MFGWWSRDRKRKQLLATPFPPEWEQILHEFVAHYARLPEALKPRLRDATRILVSERRFEGIGGFEITDAVKVTIAGQAALLVLGVDGYFFERLPSIIVRQESFSRRQKTSNWMEEDQELSGLAAQHGPITLSWRDVVQSGGHPAGGENLVLHEFAHHLDGLDGEMGGSLSTGDRAQDEIRKELFATEFHHHVAAVEHGHKTLIDPYGAVNAAEFFAVSVECFYCRPQSLQLRHPELYASLAQLFRLDPAAWQEETAPRPPQHPHPPQRHAHSHPSTRRAPPQPPALHSADEYFTRGLEFWQAGELEHALADFTAATKREPNDAELWAHRGAVLADLDRHTEAEADCRQALALEPDEAEARRTLATLLLEREQFSEALPLLNAAIDDDADGDLYFSRALGHAGLEQWQFAVEDFSSALKHHPHDRESLEGRAFCREKLGDLAGAAEDRTRASTLPDDADG